MSTDTFGEFMGVRSDPVGETVTGDLVKLTAHVPMAGTVAASAPNGYVLDGRLNDSFRAVFLLLDKGVAVRRVSAAVGRRQRQDRRLPRGRRRRRRRSRQQTGVDFVALKAPITGRRLRRFASRASRCYQRYGGGNMDEGWTRLMFEQFNVPFKSIMDAEIKAGGLEAKYDVIVLPADSVAAMTGERPPQGRRRRRRWRLRRRPGQHAARISQRLRRRGREGAAGVRPEGRHARDVRATPATCRFSASACRCATSSPACRRRSSGRRDRRCASTFDNTNPIAYGMPAEGLALFMAGGQVYEVTSTDRSQDVEILVDLRRARHPAERLAARRAGDREEGGGGVGEARRRQGRADRLPPAASRPDARHVQAGVQRAAERSAGNRGGDHYRAAVEAAEAGP